MIKRIFRALVCFLVICFLVINMSPIKAEATAATLLLSPVAVPCLTAIAAVITGLGVLAIADNPRFQVLVSDCLDSLREKGLLGNSDTIDMYKMVGDDIGQYMISQEIAEAVRDYLWESGTISVSGEAIAAGFASYNGYILPLTTEYSGSSTWSPYKNLQYIWITSDGKYFLQTYSSDDVYVSLSDNRLYPRTGGFSRASLYYSTGNSWVRNARTVGASWDYWYSNVIWSSVDIKDSAGNLLVAASDPVTSQELTVSDGLAAGTIAGQDKTFAEGYSEWASGAKTLPTLRDGEQTEAMSAYIALGMGLTLEETMAMSQADVQSGVGTYEDTLSGTASDTVTATGLKGWLDTLRLTLVSGFSNMVDNIQANTTSITTAITTFFTPSGTVEAYALDLQSLFPFCIPFDIYNLLLALQADPVTPHFDFEISFGSLGSYPVSVDFSDWNGLAELVRTLEIALFIVGLGIKTRELIGG